MVHKYQYNFGQSLRMAIEKRSVSRQYLADKMGKHRSKIDELCRTRESCTIFTALCLSRALDMPFSEFIALGED